MIKSTNETQQEDYDRALATALRLDSLIERKATKNPIASRLAAISQEFKNDMVELGEKFASASSKIAALIFMQPELLKKTDNSDQLQYSGILIKQPDLSHLFAPPSLPVSMNKKLAVESNKKAEAAKLKRQLKQELIWFQEFGRQGEGLIMAAETVTTATSNDKAKRRLTIVSDHSQAA